MKHVGKPRERGVARVAQPLARIFGEVQRQRAVRSEQAEQPHLQARAAVARRHVKRRERRRRKRQIGLLSEPYWLIDGAQRFAPARLVGVQALQPPQRLVEVVADTAPPPTRRRNSTASVSRPTAAPIW